MNILILTASNFGLNCIKYLSKKKINIKVITYKEFKIKNKIFTNNSHNNIINYCVKKKISTTEVSNNLELKKNIFNFCNFNNYQIFLCGWYTLIPKNIIINYPFFAFHSSLLPKFSGGAPLVWAIIKGEKITGITLFKVNNDIDGGPIMYQLKTRISHNDNIKTLYEKITNKAYEILDRFIKDKKNNNIKYINQNKINRTYERNRTPKDGLISFKMTDLELYNFIRAQTKPYPGAFFYINNIKITIWKSKISKQVISKQVKNKYICKIKSSYFLVLNKKMYLKILSISINNLDCKLSKLNKFL